MKQKFNLIFNIKATFFGCFESFNSVDVFNETLSLSQCNAAAALLPAGACYDGNCDSTTSTCTSNKCPYPFGSCSGTGCNKCSSTYNYIYSQSGMTNEICFQICYYALFTYSATKWG